MRIWLHSNKKKTERKTDLVRDLSKLFPLLVLGFDYFAICFIIKKYIAEIFLKYI